GPHGPPRSRARRGTPPRAAAGSAASGSTKSRVGRRDEQGPWVSGVCIGRPSRGRSPNGWAVMVARDDDRPRAHRAARDGWSESGRPGPRPGGLRPGSMRPGGPYHRVVLSPVVLALALVLFLVLL